MRSKLLLLLYLTILDVWCHAAQGLLPAPLNPSVSSENFRHLVRWTPGHGSPPDAHYQIYRRCHKQLKLVQTSTETWAEVTLNSKDTHRLCVRTSFNNSLSPLSKTITFTPYLQTNITAPNVTVSGCGKCIQVNISLPRADNRSGIQDIGEYYKPSNRISWRKQGQEAVDSIETQNQSVVIANLLPDSEYCIQVRPHYLDINFQPSSWTCVFTSKVQPRQVFAVVGAVAALVVLSISALALVLVCLQFTGFICKLKEALPQTLIAALIHWSPLSPENTVPEMVSIIPGIERGQPISNSHDSSSDEEDDRDQSGANYVDGGDQLSSGSSSICVPVTQCSQSEVVANNAGCLRERINERKEELAQGDKGGKSEEVENVMKNESKDSQKQEEWDDTMENSENVNLFSVTISALGLHQEHNPQESDLETLLNTEINSDSYLPDQQQFSDMEQEEETELSNYMRHCV